MSFFFFSLLVLQGIPYCIQSSTGILYYILLDYVNSPL